MPIYAYNCESCQHYFEVHQLFCDPPLLECPKCAAFALLRVIFPPRIYVKQSDNDVTVGHLANRHAESFSEDKKHHILNKDNTQKADDKDLPKPKSKPKPTFLDKYQTASLSEIQKMSNTQKKKYIENGEK